MKSPTRLENRKTSAGNFYRCVRFIIILFFALGFMTTPVRAVDAQWQAPAAEAAKQNPVPATPELIASGKTLYGRQCSACHGAEGKGDGPAAVSLVPKPGDLSDPKMWEVSDGALFWKISTGKGAMPPWDKAYTERQRWLIINYIRTLAPKPASNK
jgi:mono/diheme cytochrome c family protein